ncbi:MAG TPA: tetratricopeptide repeat-containing diguanylate cyclase [Lysobacter sp.]|nr:tetratricopeptide repeat-containing diguanylate cyclase [Lysobacter sp.]
MPMPRFHASLLALALAVCAATPAAAQGERAAAFDRLFEQLDSERLNPATPEEAQADLARLRALVPPGDRRRELLFQSTECFQSPEDARTQLGVAQRGLAAARQLGDAEVETRFQLCEASLQSMLGDAQKGLALFGRGVELARRAEHPALLGDALVLRGNMYSYLGRHAESLIDFMDAQRLYDGARQAERSEGNLQNIAIAYRRMGEYDKAREYLDRSRAIAQRHQDWGSLLVIALQTGFLHEDTGHPERALAFYEEALRIARQRLPVADTAPAHMAIASAQAALGNAAKALDAVAAARSGFAAIGDTSNDGMLDLLEGRARALLGETDRALALFARAEAALQRDGNERYLEALYPVRAELHEKRGASAAALADYKRYLALREKRLAERSQQRTLILREQSDASQREIENQRLRAEKALREQEVQALLKARRWQRIALGLGVALIALLGLLVGRQIVRTRRLRVLALTDELTGIANRRRIEVLGARALADARADGRPLSVVAFDIDGFKAINDGHGHLVGDQVIARVAGACQRALRQADEIGRMGGEEFLVLLPDSDIDSAGQIAERLRAGVEALTFDDVAPGLRVTISLGATALAPADDGLARLLARADKALYQAKGAGRNCIRTM